MTTLNEQLEGSIALIDRRSAAIAVADETPADPVMRLMDKFASNPNLSPELVRTMMDIYVDGHRKMQEMQDERAFADAMADFKKNPPEIIKRKQAKIKGVAKASGREYEMTYSYADLEEYASAAMPALAERGITWSFPFSENDRGVITVSCILRYGLYKNTPTTLSSPPETSGTKNDLQAKGSALSYLERYTFCGATGLVAAMPDDDAHRAQKAEVHTEEMEGAAVQDFISLIEGSSNMDELHQNYFDKARKAAEKIGDRNALNAFADAKNTWMKKHPEQVKAYNAANGGRK